MKPSSTYRVQLRPAFGFSAAAALAEYLERLGVDALYASPMLTPTPGSQHGYDVVDPSKANPELGGEPGRIAMVGRLRELGMKLVVDIVPNHMSVEVPRANHWWWDVLSQGRNSPYADYFDIDFHAGPVMIPVLGDDFSDEQLTVQDGELRYYEHAFPIAEATSEGTPAEIHQRQHYRLVNWRRGASELNYRRFFDVSNLAAVRVERPEVFEDTHREVLRWVAEGDVDGLRVDHPDGLSQPGRYLRTLSAKANCWLLVEKILEPGERLPVSWPVDGTTGYDALREICGVFVDTQAQEQLTELAGNLGVPTNYPEVLDTSRHLVAERLLGAEVNRIARELAMFFTSNLSDTVVDEKMLRAAVTEVLCAFAVYRSYRPENGKRDWDNAIDIARTNRPELAELINEIGRQGETPLASAVTRLQQTSGMVVAKGTEDTAFYRYNRFIAANEVGGNPEHIGISVEDFHTASAEREASQRHTMTTLSTHDTKRSEDVRARLATLSEIPEDFAAAVRRWTERAPLPEASLNLLGWQTLVGAWPISAERLAGYLDKASKEAKLGTSWYDREPEFEHAVDAWPQTVLGDKQLSEDVEQFVERIRSAGWSNSLGQKLIQLCGPGIPDVYQGTELWDYSLVDPDNRRDVDFAERERILSELERGELPDIEASGAVKLHVVRTALRLRREQPRLFRHYRPVEAEGSAAAHALAFGRGRGIRLLAVATRLPISLAAAGGWGDTRLPIPEGEWTDLLTGQRHLARNGNIELATLLDRYPIALLTRAKSVAQSTESE